MILDSSFLIDLMDTDENALERAALMDTDGTIERIPVQVIQELYVGVGYLEDGFSEVERIQAVTENREIVETTLEIAKLAGRIDGTLRRDGDRLPPGDIVVGATARHFGDPVMTGDVEHFERMPDVEVRTY